LSWGIAPDIIAVGERLERLERLFSHVQGDVALIAHTVRGLEQELLPATEGQSIWVSVDPETLRKKNRA